MIGKHLTKSLASSAAVGVALASTALAAPAVVTAPMSHTDCGSYAAPTTTNTSLSLSRNVIQFGQVVIASAQASGQGNPSGTITFSVNGDAFATVSEAAAADGVRVPRRGAGDTYTVRARFHPNCTSQYDYSASSDSSSLTVFKADTSTTARARNREQGQRPVVRGIVDSATPAEPGGQVEVTISNGDVSRTQTVGVVKNDDGTSSYRAEFGRVFKRGEWDVVSRYLGTRNFKRSSASTTFRVTR